MKGVLLLLVAVVTSSALNAQSKWKAFENTENSIKTVYPADWSLKVSKYDDIAVFTAPDSDGDGFSQSIKLHKEDLGGYSMPLMERVNLILNQAKAALADYKQIQWQNRTVNGMEAYEVVYEGSQQGIRYRWKQVFIIVNSVAFYVLFTDRAAYYDEHIKQADVVINSFQFN